MNEKLGRLIKKKRKKYKLTQEDLAKKLNVTASSVSNWETGVNFPEKELIPKICETLKINEKKLYDKPIIKRETYLLDELSLKKKKLISVLRFVVLSSVLFVVISTILTLYTNTFDLNEKSIMQYNIETISESIKIDKKQKEKADENLEKIKNASNSNFDDKTKKEIIDGLEKIKKNCEVFGNYDLSSKNNYQFASKLIKLINDDNIGVGAYARIAKEDNRDKEEKQGEKAYLLTFRYVMYWQKMVDEADFILMQGYKFPFGYNIRNGRSYGNFLYCDYYLALTEYAMKVGGINE